LLLADWRHVDFTSRHSTEKTSPVDKACGSGYMPVANLLDAYERNPDLVITQLRRELGKFDTLSAEVFATIVYLSDDYFTFNQSFLEKIEAEKGIMMNSAKPSS